jgi:hypothetical protein
MDTYERELAGVHIDGLAAVRRIDSWARALAARLATGVQSAT